MNRLSTWAFTIASLVLGSTFAFAAGPKSTSTQPGYVVKDAIKRKGGAVDHTLETRDNSRKVFAWEGPARGPGAKKIRVAVVKGQGGDHETMVKNTVISGQLMRKGKAEVRKTLNKLGIKGTIELGDHMPANANRLAQQPISREEGKLRYTVTQPNGTKIRFLVPVSATKLANGDKKILGKAVRDNDGYGQTPQP